MTNSPLSAGAYAHACARFLLLCCIGLAAGCGPSSSEPPDADQKSQKLDYSAAEWDSAGPSPIEDPENVGLPFAYGKRASGAVDAIVLDPTGGGTILYAASVNGGVWKNQNYLQPLSPPNLAQWQTTMDHLPSLAMGGLALDPTNSLHVVAATGCHSSSTWMCGVDDVTGTFQSNAVEGLIYESVSGANGWSVIGEVGERVQAMTVRGELILVATGAPRQRGSIYRRAASGDVFTDLFAGDDIGPVLDLVADPTHEDRYFAVFGHRDGQGGVYKSEDNGGQAWERISDDATQSVDVTDALNANSSNARLAVAPSGRLMVVVATLGQITRIAYTDDRGEDWTYMDTPTLPQWSNYSGNGIRAITDITRSAGVPDLIVTTDTDHGLVNDVIVRVANVPALGGEDLNGDWRTLVVSPTQFSLINLSTGTPGTGTTSGANVSVSGGYSFGKRSISVDTVFRAANTENVVVTTTEDHGYGEHTNVLISGVPFLDGNSVNGTWRIKPISSTQFELLDRFTGDPGTGASSAADVTVTGGNTFGMISPNNISFARHLLAVAIDPVDDDVVYVSGDFSPIKIARGNVNQVSGLVPSRQWTSLDLQLPGTSTESGSRAHEDTRDLIVDSARRLLIATDGGVYLNTNPRTATGDWHSLAGDMGTAEVYSIDIEPLSGALIAGLQDNGSPASDDGTGTAPNGDMWFLLTWADGLGVASVNSGRTVPGPAPGDPPVPYAFRYTACQDEDCFTRFLRDVDGKPVMEDLDGDTLPDDGTRIPLEYDSPRAIYDVVDTTWMNTLVTNPYDPDRLLIGARGVKAVGDAVEISSVVRVATTADIVVTTAAAHGLSTGEGVRLMGVPDLVAGESVDGDWAVQVTSNTEFELIDMFGGGPGNGNTTAANVNGGTAVGLASDEAGDALVGGVWESHDRGETIAPIPVSGSDVPLGATGIDAGALNNVDALWAATPSGLYFRMAAGGAMTKSNFPAGEVPLAVVMDPDNPETVFVTTNAHQVWTSENGVVPDAIWENITGDLEQVARLFLSKVVTANPRNFHDIAYIPGPADDRIVISAASGTTGAYMMALGQPGVWTRIGHANQPSLTIPYAPVTTLDYDPLSDRLVVGTAGRGAWVVDEASQLNRAPLARCKDLTVAANASCQAYVSGPSFNDGSEDVDSPDPVFFGIFLGPGQTNTSFGPYELGDSPIVVKVSDNQGASSLCAEVTLTVEDQTRPTLEIPEDFAIGTCSGGGSVNVGTATANDNCAVDIDVTGHVVSKNGMPLSPPIEVIGGMVDLGPGVYEIEWVADDGATEPVTGIQLVSLGSAIQAGQTYLVAQGGQVQDSMGNPASVLNSGTGSTIVRGIQTIGGVAVPARVGSIHAGGSVEVNQGGQVFGDIYAVGNTSQVNMSGVTGSIVPVTSTGLPPLPTLPAIPAATINDFPVNPGETKTIQPGNYRSVSVNGNSTPGQHAILTFLPGDYYVTNLYLNAAGVNVVASPGTRIFVRQQINFHSPFRVSVNSNDLAPVYLGIAGTGSVGMYAPFNGTIVAPGRSLSFGTGNGLTFRGSFYAAGIEVTPGSILVCDAAANVPESCADGITNFDETDEDCGGPQCGPCADSDTCLVGADCTSKVCPAGICLVPTCADGEQNGSETGEDCGGSCPACPVACNGQTYQAENMGNTTGNAWYQGGWNIYSNGSIYTMHTFTPGPNVITVSAFGQQALNVLPHMRVTVGGVAANPSNGVSVSTSGFNPYTFTFNAAGGPQEIRVIFDNDASGWFGDRNLIVDYVDVDCQ